MADLERSAEELFAQALELAPARRAAFLDETCRQAPELRRVVEHLLQQTLPIGSVPAQPMPVNETAAPVNPSRFHPGQLIANRFRVVRFIARGGMGEVYEVRDQFLQDAGVALKIIRPEIAADAATASRFEQEVILARKVVHTHLCPIYEIFRCEQPAPSFLFLTMKLLQGETLDTFLRGSTKPDSATAVEICSQLLSGVAALHAAGVIHRDLKPNNVMLERTDQRLNVSIMDFGLARLQQAESSVLGSGMIAGTPGYMAPELLRGERPTKATDLFALGIVLHQVLTGERPMPSERGLSLSPSPSLRKAHVPVPLLQAVEDFLSPEPERRISAFVRVQPSQGSLNPSAGLSRSRSLRGKAAWYWFAGAVALAGAGLALYRTPAPVSGPLDSTQITFSATPKEGPLFTDGLRFYFESAGVPSEMAVSGGIIAPMPQVQLGMRLMDISSDGSKVLEWKPDTDDAIRRGSLWMASSLGGAPRRLGNYLVNTPDWGAAAFSPDGQSIVFTDQRMLYIADANGANVKQIWEAPQSVDGVRFSPDGRELTVTLWGAKNPSRMWMLKANGESPHPLLPQWPANSEQWGAQWTPDGRHFVFTSELEGRPNVYELISPLWFEFWKKPSAVRITGNQIPILASAPARDSTHLFVLGRADQGMMQALDTKTGKWEPFPGGLSASEFAISPDRQWMAYSDLPDGHLWKSKLDGSQPVQITNSPAYGIEWSPDGKTLLYNYNFKLYLVSADGGTPEKLIATGEHEGHGDWSPDGKSIAVFYYNPTEQPAGGLFAVDMASRKVSLEPGTEGLLGSTWSPDGRYRMAWGLKPSRTILYSAKTGKWKLLAKFQEPVDAAAWSKDSKSVFMAMAEGHNGIYRLTIPDGKFEKISDLAGTYTEQRGGNATMSLTADGRPAMVVTTGVGQIYSLHWK
jgi:serine/threonine protein kinase/Tol biopolymer transport system component